MLTAPNGQRKPLLCWPEWSPGLANERARKRTWSPEKFCTPHASAHTCQPGSTS